MDDTAPAKFAAGWFRSALGHETVKKQFVDEVVACVKRRDELTYALNDSMRYYSSDKEQGDKMMKEFKALLIPAMADCGQIAEAMHN